MEVKFNVTGSERKRLVTAISEITGTKSKYLGMPSMAFEIGYFTVDKNGTLSFDRADSEEVKALLETLTQKGFTAEGNQVEEVIEESDTEPHGENVGLCVAMPRSYFSGDTLENLNHLISSKASLIKKALDIDSLPIEVDDEKVNFPWFSTQSDEALIRAYSHFVTALCDMARNQKRVNATEKKVENEKYAFRCFLLRLGFIGAEYKDERKVLLKNFTGSSAFKGGRMNFPSREIVEKVRKDYPVGTRVELVQMDDVQAPPIGTKGVVKGVDDIGSIMVKWNNGCGLSVVYGEDIVKKVAE